MSYYEVGEVEFIVLLEKEHETKNPDSSNLAR